MRLVEQDMLHPAVQLVGDPVADLAATEQVARLHDEVVEVQTPGLMLGDGMIATEPGSKGQKRSRIAEN